MAQSWKPLLRTKHLTCLPARPCVAVLSPLTCGTERVCVRRKHGTSPLTHSHIEGDSGSAEVGRKWRVPPPRGHILSSGGTASFVQGSQLFVCTCHAAPLLRVPRIDRVRVATCGIPQRIPLVTWTSRSPAVVLTLLTFTGHRHFLPLVHLYTRRFKGQ